MCSSAGGGNLPGTSEDVPGGTTARLGELLGDLGHVTEPAIVGALTVAVEGRRWGIAARLAGELERREAAREREAVAAVMGALRAVR